MAADPAPVPEHDNVSKATGRILIAKDCYATIAVTCRVRAVPAVAHDRIQELGEQYLSLTSGYATAVGRLLADSGASPERIEVDSQCDLEGADADPRLARLTLVVRGVAPESDNASLASIAKDEGLLQSSWKPTRQTHITVAATLMGGVTRDPPKPAAAILATSEKSHGNASGRRLLMRLALVVVLFAAITVYVLVRAHGQPGDLTLISAPPADQPVATLSAAAGLPTEAEQSPLAATPPAPIAVAGVRLTELPASLPTTPRGPLVTLPTFTPVPPTSTPAPAAAPAVPFKETFASNVRGWPDDQRSTAWFADGGYRLATREPTKFVAVRAPASDRFTDVRVGATFQKLGGALGGGYGVILRDASPTPLDGLVQTGQYYVFEVGDKGEIGIWRRDNASWIELQPWTPSPAVRNGTQVNSLEARAQGSRLDFWVNGTLVATHDDQTLGAGAVGVFVGGDGNDVLLSEFAVQPLT